MSPASLSEVLWVDFATTENMGGNLFDEVEAAGICSTSDMLWSELAEVDEDKVVIEVVWVSWMRGTASKSPDPSSERRGQLDSKLGEGDEVSEGGGEIDIERCGMDCLLEGIFEARVLEEAASSVAVFEKQVI
jgi:hypothetical protein